MRARVCFPGTDTPEAEYELRAGLDWLADAIGEGNPYLVQLFWPDGSRVKYSSARWADTFEEMMDLWEDAFEDAVELPRS